MLNGVVRTVMKGVVVELRACAIIDVLSPTARCNVLRPRTKIANGDVGRHLEPV